MRLATLTGVDVPSRRFTYTLSVPYFVFVGSMSRENTYESPVFEVFSRDDFTKIWDCRHREMIKTLGVESHAQVLEARGYIRAVDLGFVQACTDEELLTCLYEFEKTGDDIHVFKWAVANR